MRTPPIRVRSGPTRPPTYPIAWQVRQEAFAPLKTAWPRRTSPEATSGSRRSIRARFCSASASMAASSDPARSATSGPKRSRRSRRSPGRRTERDGEASSAATSRRPSPGSLDSSNAGSRRGTESGPASAIRSARAASRSGPRSTEASRSAARVCSDGRAVGVEPFDQKDEQGDRPASPMPPGSAARASSRSQRVGPIVPGDPEQGGADVVDPPLGEIERAGRGDRRGEALRLGIGEVRNDGVDPGIGRRLDGGSGDRGEGDVPDRDRLDPRRVGDHVPDLRSGGELRELFDERGQRGGVQVARGVDPGAERPDEGGAPGGASAGDPGRGGAQFGVVGGEQGGDIVSVEPAA